jgi:hypothetical protein
MLRANRSYLIPRSRIRTESRIESKRFDAGKEKFAGIATARALNLEVALRRLDLEKSFLAS